MARETTQSPEDAIVSKAFWRLIPFLFLCYVVAFLDRVNVGFAALQMNKALSFSPTVFSFGAGLFFLGYFVFEVPSNLLMERIGARRWIPRIMISWGVLACASAFIAGETSFYVLRFLLGLAEAGFIPGVVLYLTYWFPIDVRTRTLSWFLIGIPLAIVIGSPISGAILQIDGAFGLGGWQWLFLLQGLPAIILGIAGLWILINKPDQAKWLSPQERSVLAAKLKEEDKKKVNTTRIGLATTLFDPRIVLLGIANFLWAVGFYGLTIWLPQIIKAMGNLSNVEIGFVNAVPYVMAAAAMIGWSKLADRWQALHWCYALATFVGAAGLALSAYVQSPVTSIILIAIAMGGILAALPMLFALPSSFLSAATAAPGIAMVTTIGNLGGFFGPYLVGWMRSVFTSFTYALLCLSLAIACAGLLALIARAVGRTQDTRNAVSRAAGERKRLESA